VEHLIAVMLQHSQNYERAKPVTVVRNRLIVYCAWTTYYHKSKILFFIVARWR